MRAIVIEKKGGPEVLEYRTDEPDPTPGPDDLLVAVEAIGVNYRDVYEREGRGAAYGRAKVPLIIGAEGAGTVVETGERVAWAAAPASYAERCAVPRANAISIPDGVSSEQAAAVILQGITAHYLCMSTYAIHRGDVAVVHAAAGGVGLLLTQMIKRFGGTVVATTSTAEKAELAKQAGADHTVGYDRFADTVKELGGAHVVYDAVGKDTFEAGMDVLRARGMFVLYGMASGPAPEYDPQRLQAKSLYLTRPGLPAYTATREELESRAADVLGWIADGSLDVRIGGRYPLEHARRAHEDLEARRSTGKLLLIP